MADSELNHAEDLLKEQYLTVIRNMSHVELKKFNKYDYKKKVIRDMSKMHPAYDITDLDGYAQCVSNALNSEVQSLLNSRSRAQTVSDKSDSTELSNTFLEELDTTMRSDTDIGSQSQLSSTTTMNDDDDQDDFNDDDDDEDSDDESDSADHSQTNGATPSFDDSVTLLKEVHSTGTREIIGSAPASTAHGVQPDKQDIVPGDRSNSTKQTRKCCDTCKIN